MPLVRDIAAAAHATVEMSPEVFGTVTHICGTRNAHLADPENRDSRTGHYRDRETPLPMDAEIRGDFLTLTFYDHDGYVLLTDHDSLQDVEEAIRSRPGVLNGFVGFLLAFVHGRQRGYEVRDQAGNVLAKDGQRVASLDRIDAAGRVNCVWTGE
jgi:hypothetical protein